MTPRLEPPGALSYPLPMPRFAPIALACFSLVLLWACTPARDSSIDTSVEVSVLASLSALASGVHLLNPDNSGVSRTTHETRLWDGLFPISRAHATITNCAQAAAADICVGETKTASYTDCPVGGLGILVSGSVVLTFTPTAANCAFTAAGSTVTRAMSLSRTTLTGGNITTSSATRTDYQGESYGGGMRLTRIDATHYTFDVLGVHKARTSLTGDKVYEISMRTTTPFDFLGVPTGNFTLDGGAFEIAHNNAGYLATVSADNVTFDYSTCCYPIGGAFSVVYSGKATGTAAVSFGGTCGRITYARDGNLTQLDLIGCE